MTAEELAVLPESAAPCDTPPVCARFTLMMPWADLVRLLGGDVRAQVHGRASWNIALTQQVAIIEDSTRGRHSAETTAPSRSSARAPRRR